MSQKIDQFCNDLRGRLTAAEGRLQSLQGRVKQANQESHDAIDAKLNEAKTELAQTKQQAEENSRRMQTYLDEKKTETRSKIDSLKQEHEIKALDKRAERAEGHAVDVTLFALAAIDEAHVATLEAIQARLDSDELVEARA